MFVCSAKKKMGENIVFCFKRSSDYYQILQHQATFVDTIVFAKREYTVYIKSSFR